MSRAVPDFDAGTERNYSNVYLTIRASEYEQLRKVYAQMGGNLENLDGLDEPTLGHNNGISQLVRFILNGQLPETAVDPVSRPTESDLYTKMEVALTQEEYDSLRSTEECEHDFRNRDAAARQLRQNVILPFCKAVTRGEN